MLLRETAGNLTIDQGAVDRERGVVLSEERARDNPPYRVYKARLGFLLKDQRPPTRLPIGQVDVLKNAPASLIADFYHHYYRPERAVLVAVGDFDPAAMEAKIKARFSDWTAVGPAGPEPYPGRCRRPRPRGQAGDRARRAAVHPGRLDPSAGPLARHPGHPQARTGPAPGLLGDQPPHAGPGPLRQAALPRAPAPSRATSSRPPRPPCW